MANLTTQSSDPLSLVNLVDEVPLVLTDGGEVNPTVATPYVPESYVHHSPGRGKGHGKGR